MASIASSEPAYADTQPQTLLSRGWPAAVAVLTATFLSLVGICWDSQWHADVGPDTFFTLPHLLLYSGSAISGLVSLAVVLSTTAKARAGHRIDPATGGQAVAVFRGTFKAPVGYLVAGAGSASFLLYGMYDLWWHEVYGFDAVLESPPHIGLLLSITISMGGAILVFAAARDRRWGMPGAVAATSMLLAIDCLLLVVLELLGKGVEWVALGTGSVSALLLLAIRAMTGRKWAMVQTAGALAVIQLVLWWFSPWVTKLYADSLGLPLRDDVLGIPVMPVVWPMCLVLVALVAELLVKDNKWRYGLVGALTAGTVAACAPYQAMIVAGEEAPAGVAVVLAVVLGALLGGAAGLAMHGFGRVLRQVRPEVQA
ncbi:hypothetical protein [Kribbella solani]|uniref:Uncharacterized protein n=1 Tax=Kribbella solani TaxID=236067 RepID=A0A841DUX3_9ACTN|nr:hypothetical protein [Kribbella solani]MBB5980077.1 hypothetical protein [Kribbella solani]MDX2971289.1 hypothetical protein [Kribbella solani]MDX3005552.1 hypothetical protein [Kribbella solani]